MAPHAVLFTRDALDDADRSGSSSKGTIIAGICVAAASALAVALWLGIRWYRKRLQRKREDARGAAFLNVKGIVKVDDEKDMLSIPPESQFSRAQLGPTIVMPNKTIRPGATKDEIIRYHADHGTLTRPFSSYAPQGPDTLPHLTIGEARPISTISFTPPLSPNRNSSPLSSIFPRASMASGFSDGSSRHGVEKRKVRQLFNPVLPDELVINVGERITVVQSFDDGWCIVGRDSMLTPGEVEMGAVPAWCFIKPVKGLRAERPMRVSSLGVTVEMDDPGSNARDNLISWSNF
ncbi:hypothetical protein EWM64_g384 [Hericium alpestre]|uniref:SH3 domain-containing protein n=1 Tax=Hericium alpestre TaxID=135208 RepID=A0A4Z0ABA7_9AGAM|nr:hypothetical protein EWM64_g384 [Hericium alpestre]